MSDASSSPRKRAPSKRLKPTPLGENDWVDAATEILIQENVRGIRIDALCKKLGVTKGSFYWHFQSRGDLLKAMLTSWRRRMTLNIIQNVSNAAENSRVRLHQLIALPRRSRSPAFAQIEQSIRDWGRRVEQAEDAVTEVDRIRFEYFFQLFHELGFDEKEARLRAYMAYTMMMGDSVLHHTLTDVDGVEFANAAVSLLTESKMNIAKT
jgi:AcrR family transcriptional regulator